MGAALETSLLLLLYQSVYRIVVVDMGCAHHLPHNLGSIPGNVAAFYGAQRCCESRKGELMGFSAVLLRHGIDGWIFDV